MDEMNKAVLISAMQTLGYTYDWTESYDEWLHFWYTGGSTSFSSWQELEDWVRGVVIDDPYTAEELEKIMKEA